VEKRREVQTFYMGSTMKILISSSASSIERTKISELKKKKADIVAKCRADLAKIDLQLKALGHKSDMKLSYGKPKLAATPELLKKHAVNSIKGVRK